MLIIVVCSCQSKPHQEATSIDHPIIGKWKVIHSNLIPFEHISYCEKLYEGSIFDFNKWGKLKVYPKNKSRNCNKKQNFYIDSTRIQIIEWDMSISYEIKIITTDTLQFKSEYFPSYLIDVDDPILDEKIKKEGVIVTLIKMHND